MINKTAPRAVTTGGFGGGGGHQRKVKKGSNLPRAAPGMLELRKLLNSKEFSEN
jgi:hypothetical protein